MSTVIEKTAVNYSYLTDLIGHLAGLTHLRATQLCTAELASIGLTPKQFVALEFIANNPTISQKEIAKHIGTTPTVLVNILDVMTERGLLMRVRSMQDRRRHSVVLTEKGEALRARVRRSAYSVEAQLKHEGGLNDSEWQTLQKLMQKLARREEKK